MARLNRIENIVLPIMMSKPRARDDDNYLFAEFVKVKYPEIADMPFCEVMTHYSHIIKIKSVERVRRKLQEKYPDLRGRSYEKRHGLEEEYINYARGNDNDN